MQNPNQNNAIASEFSRLFTKAASPFYSSGDREFGIWILRPEVIELIDFVGAHSVLLQTLPVRSENTAILKGFDGKNFATMNGEEGYITALLQPMLQEGFAQRFVYRPSSEDGGDVDDWIVQVDLPCWMASLLDEWWWQTNTNRPQVYPFTCLLISLLGQFGLEINPEQNEVLLKAVMSANVRKDGQDWANLQEALSKIAKEGVPGAKRWNTEIAVR